MRTNLQNQTKSSVLFLYNQDGDVMKKLIPYVCSLALGLIFGFLLFQDAKFNIKEVFADNLRVTAFQLGVFNNEKSALDLKKKYDGAIVMQDEDVYRVYYSILTNDKVIAKMEEYLTNKKISYYLKSFVVKDASLIKAINEYEGTMAEGSETVLVSVNKLITSSYGGGV